MEHYRNHTSCAEKELKVFVMSHLQPEPVGAVTSINMTFDNWFQNWEDQYFTNTHSSL